MVCITGVSGSGNTLVEDVLYRGLKKRKGEPVGIPGPCRDIVGWEQIADVIFVDQTPIGTTPRANLLTYTKAFDPLRRLLADTEIARLRGYLPGTFSFNVEGGRCETCKGEGFEKVEMQFLSDVYVPCPECHGKRFRAEVLEVTYRGKNLTEIMNLTAAEAMAFSPNKPRSCEDSPHLSLLVWTICVWDNRSPPLSEVKHSVARGAYWDGTSGKLWIVVGGFLFSLSCKRGQRGAGDFSSTKTPLLCERGEDFLLSSWEAVSPKGKGTPSSSTNPLLACISPTSKNC
jgi:hypothetical protein